MKEGGVSAARKSNFIIQTLQVYFSLWLINQLDSLRWGHFHFSSKLEQLIWQLTKVAKTRQKEKNRAINESVFMVYFVVRYNADIFPLVHTCHRKEHVHISNMYFPFLQLTIIACRNFAEKCFCAFFASDLGWLIHFKILLARRRLEARSSFTVARLLAQNNVKKSMECELLFPENYGIESAIN